MIFAIALLLACLPRKLDYPKSLYSRVFKQKSFPEKRASFPESFSEVIISGLPSL
jgi:hypothetical protein